MARLRTHPGEVLKEEFMAPFGLSTNKLAIDLAQKTRARLLPVQHLGSAAISERRRLSG